MSILINARVEVVVDRDPDGGTEVAVFVDGNRVDDAEVTVIDPGAGYDRRDWVDMWREGLYKSTRDAGLAIDEAFNNYANSEWITES